MPPLQAEEVDKMFDDHPSLAASLEDFEHQEPERSPMFGIPSAHSGFLSEQSEPESEPAAPWSPPWRKESSGWYQRHRFMPPSPSRSRTTSPVYESAGEGDLTLPANIPLPESPLKQTPRTSPDRDVTVVSPRATPARESVPPEEREREESQPPDNQNNYVRFAVRAEVQHGTDAIENAMAWFRDKIDLVTKSRTNFVLSTALVCLAAVFIRVLFAPQQPGPVPDLVKVAGLAKSFEPLIYYSENGVQHVGELQETSVAVWDLGESVRSTNMTSAPIIVEELDDLSQSLKTLSIELTKFFASVDGDVDSILIVMDWAKRELSRIQSLPLNSFTSAFDNIHTMLCHVGILEGSHGVPTTMGKVFSQLFGQTTQQRTKYTLHRTFNEFLNVLEESINTELTHSVALFSLFEAIDRQFLNLQRTVIRETDQQEQQEAELLSSLWSRVMGGNASMLRKYEKNRQLLASVRDKTVRNKHIVVEHNGKLLQLKSSLEILRKKLVSPLVRSNNSSTLSIEEQIAGLDATHLHLRGVRERQKGKVMEMLYGFGNRRIGLSAGQEREHYAIDGN